MSVCHYIQAWELRMEKSAEKWGSRGRRRLLVGVRERRWSFLTKIRRKNCITQPCIFEFCQFITWCKTITFWFERTVWCFGVDIFLFQWKSVDLGQFPCLYIFIIIRRRIALKGAIQDFLQSPHCTANHLQHLRWSGPGAIVSKSRAPHWVLIMCYMSCYIPCGKKRQLSCWVWQSWKRIYLSFILLAEPLTDEGGEKTRVPG